MSEWSDYHRAIEQRVLGAPPETVRREYPYRGFLLQRTDPARGHMWTISDTQKKDVAGLGGAFTKLQLALDAVDRYIKDQEETEKQYSETTEQNN
jgi:hypothetical protein